MSNQDCERCNHTFIESDLQRFNDKILCSECFEIEYTLNMLKPHGNHFMLILDKHVEKDIVVLPIQTSVFGIFNYALQLTYEASKIVQILQEFVTNESSKVADLFNSNFIIIDIEP